MPKPNILRPRNIENASGFALYNKVNASELNDIFAQFEEDEEDINTTTSAEEIEEVVLDILPADMTMMTIDEDDTYDVPSLAPVETLYTHVAQREEEEYGSLNDFLAEMNELLGVEDDSLDKHEIEPKESTEIMADIIEDVGQIAQNETPEAPFSINVQKAEEEIGKINEYLWDDTEDTVEIMSPEELEAMFGSEESDESAALPKEFKGDFVDSDISAEKPKKFEFKKPEISSILSEDTINRGKSVAQKLVSTVSNYGVIDEGTHGTCSWEIDYFGELKIYPTNKRAGLLDNQNVYPLNKHWYRHTHKIRKVTVARGVHANREAAFLFSGLSRCTEFNIKKLNVSKTVDFTCMFEGCHAIRKLEFGWWNTSNAEKMGGMFNGCRNLKNIDVSNFNTEKVRLMCGMFRDCVGLKTLNIDNFDIQNAKDMSTMFFNCTNLKELSFKNYKDKNFPTNCDIYNITFNSGILGPRRHWINFKNTIWNIRNAFHMAIYSESLEPMKQ